MAPLPPQYQAPTIDRNKLYEEQKNALAGGYQSQIGQYEGQKPLIQQQYENLKNELLRQQQQGQQTYETDAKRSIGKTGDFYAKRGLTNSTFQNNQEQNITDGKQQRINDLIATITNRTAAANNEQSQRTNAVDSAIAELRGRWDKDAWGMTDNLIAQQEQAAKERWARDMSLYQQQQEQDRFQQQLAEQRAARSAATSSADKQLAAMRNQNLGNWTGMWNDVLAGTRGKSASEAQNDVYRFLQNNQGAMRDMGIDPKQLGWWNTWDELYNSSRQSGKGNGGGGGWANFMNGLGGSWNTSIPDSFKSTLYGAAAGLPLGQSGLGANLANLYNLARKKK